MACLDFSATRSVIRWAMKSLTFTYSKSVCLISGDSSTPTNAMHPTWSCCGQVKNSGRVIGEHLPLLGLRFGRFHNVIVWSTTSSDTMPWHFYRILDEYEYNYESMLKTKRRDTCGQNMLVFPKLWQQKTSGSLVIRFFLKQTINSKRVFGWDSECELHLTWLSHWMVFQMTFQTAFEGMILCESL